MSDSRPRKNLAKIWERVESTREVAILRRHGHEDMVLVPAVDFNSLREITHLLRSPTNAARLLTALGRSRRSETKSPLEELRKELGLDEPK